MGVASKADGTVSEKTSLGKRRESRYKAAEGVPARFVGALFYVPQKTDMARPLLASIRYGFSKRRRSLTAFVNVSCPRLPAPVTA
jgi:hypothetical protein